MPLSTNRFNYPLKFLIYEIINFMKGTVGSLVVMAASPGPEGPGSNPDAAKDPPSKCGVLARKIRGSENPVVGR